MYAKKKWQSDVYCNFGYMEYLPQDYDETKKYPIIFFLHGIGERGDSLEDLDRVAIHGPMKYVVAGEQYPFILIAPQCPSNNYWGGLNESLNAFVDDMIRTHAVDENRVYLTGLSMGGTGTWMLAMSSPEKWAAIAPVCGSGIPWYAASLREVPIHMFHGDDDQAVSVHEAITMLTRVNAAGGDAQIKIYYGVGHNCWNQAYDGDMLWKWLLSHTRGEKNS